MTSLTEETVYTSLHYPRGSMNSHSPHRTPLDTLSVIDPPGMPQRPPGGSLRASLTTPDLHSYYLPITKLHGVTIQKNIISIFGVYKTLNPKFQTDVVSF